MSDEVRKKPDPGLLIKRGDRLMFSNETHVVSFMPQRMFRSIRWVR